MKPRVDWALIALGAALIAGALLRLWDLSNQSLFLDEGYTVWLASQSWSGMMHHIVYNDFHPPLFYALTYAAIRVLHWPVWDYRFLTVPWGLLTIVASWAIARRIFGDAAAAITAIIIAVEPSIIEWDRLFRMYSVMTAIAALSWWLVLVAPEKKGAQARVLWALYIATAVVQPYIQYLGAVDVLCQGLYAVSDLRRRWPIIAGGVLAVVALAPWFWAIRIQYPNGGYVSGTAEIPIEWSTLGRDVLFAGAPTSWLAHGWFDWVANGATIAVCIVGASLARRSILPYWLAVGALQIVATLVMGKSLVVPRYFLHVVPAIVIAFSGILATMLASRARVAGLVFAFAAPAMMCVAAADLIWDPYYQFTDWYLVNLVVLEHEQPSDAMLFVQEYPYVIVGDFTAFRNHPAQGPSMPGDVPRVMRWITANRSRRVWYIENQVYFPDPHRTIKAHLDKTRRRLGLWSEARADGGDVVNVVLYGPETSTPRGVRRVTRSHV